MSYGITPRNLYDSNDSYGLSSSGQSNSGFSAQNAAVGATGLINPLIPIGLNLAGGIFKAIRGDPKKKYRKALEDMIGQDAYSGNPIDVGKYVMMNRQLMLPQANKYGMAVNKRFGFDQGRGQGEFFDRLMEQESGNLYNLNLRNEEEMLAEKRAKMARELQIRMALLGS